MSLYVVWTVSFTASTGDSERTTSIEHCAINAPRTPIAAQTGANTTPAENHDLSRTGAPIHRVERLHLILDWLGKYI